MDATTQSTPQKQQASEIREGMRVPFFEPGSLRTPLIAEAINPVVAIANAFSNLKITRKLSVADADGNFPQTGEFKMTDQGAEIILGDGPASTGAGFPNDDQTFTASCPAGTHGTSITVNIAAGTLFSPVSVADANSLALQVATYEAESSLVCGADVTSGTIDQMALLSDGSIVIIGNFHFIGGWSRPCIALLKQDLSLTPAAWKPQVPIGGSGRFFAALCVDSNDYIYLVGAANNSQGFDCLFWTTLFQATKDGGIQGDYGNFATTFQPLGISGGSGSTSYVCAFYDAASSRVFLGGNLSAYNGVTTHEVFAITTTGAKDTSFLLSAGTAPRVGIISDGAGGIYTWGGSGGATQFVRTNSGGTIDGTFQPWTGSGASHLGGVPGPFGCKVQGGNLIVTGSSITVVSANGGTNYVLARISGSTGAVDLTFATSANNTGYGFANGSQVEIDIQGTGKIICGGNFSAFNGNTTHNLLRLNSDGTFDSSWICQTNGQVQMILIEPAGTILVCGAFTLIGDGTGSPYTLNMVPRYGIARLDSAGNVL